MRTTLTLDDDLAMELQAKARDERRAFKDVVNEAIRRGLTSPANAELPPYRVKASPMGMRSGVDLANINALLTDMDVERYLEVARRYETSGDDDEAHEATSS